MTDLLEGLEGVAVYMDNVIFHGKDIIAHDTLLQTTSERMEQAGLKLNKEKCVF